MTWSLCAPCLLYCFRHVPSQLVYQLLRGASQTAQYWVTNKARTVCQIPSEVWGRINVTVINTVSGSTFFFWISQISAVGSALHGNKCWVFMLSIKHNPKHKSWREIYREHGAVSMVICVPVLVNEIFLEREDEHCSRSHSSATMTCILAPISSAQYPDRHSSSAWKSFINLNRR